ncbi:MAG: hypothetical protein OXC81_07355, partial [Betaproteobacteria bacterium]|nr:hypothetical protein [Betaproteobacteria bacterium]
LPVEKCSQSLYTTLKKLKASYSALMQLNAPPDYDFLNSPESSIENTHAIIESQHRVGPFTGKSDIIRGPDRVSLRMIRSGWKKN